MGARILCIFLVAVFPVGSHAVGSYQTCPAEKNLYTYEENITYIWPLAANNSLQPSIPPCMDQNDRYIIRECINGLWYPENFECSYIANSTECPTGFFQSDSHCIQINGPQTFHQPCPQGTIKYYNNTILNTIAPFWLPIRRKNNNTFIYTSLDKTYGREFQTNSNSFDCFTLQNGETIFANCSDQNYQLCLHKPKIKSEITKRNISLELKFDKKREKLLLNVYSPSNLIITVEEDYAIYCFTDAAKNELKSRVKKKQIFNSQKKKKKNRNKMEDLIVYQISIKHDYPGQYYCEAYDLEENLIQSNILIGYKKKKGNEYALRILLEEICRQNCSIITTEMIYEYLDKGRFKSTFADCFVRVMEIYGKTAQGVDVLLHLSSLHGNNVIWEYYELLGKIRSFNFTLIHFRSCENCLPEKKDNISWRITDLGNRAIPNELCVDSQDIPVTRECQGNFLQGAFWSQNFNKCSDRIEASSKTLELHQCMLNQSSESIETVANLTSETDDLTPLDVYYVANIMQQAQPNDDNVIQTLDNILETESDTLKKSQIILNATDTILDSMETFLHQQEVADEVILVRKNNFLIHITKPYLSNTTGIAIYPDKIININFNENFDKIINADLEMAVYVPEELLESLISEETDIERENLTIITTIYFKDKLFNSLEAATTSGLIVSVSIPDFGIFLEEPIPLIFRSENTSAECAFWEYGANSPNKTGRWSSSGGNFLGLNQSHAYCAFTHLTHFALLIMSQKILVDDPDLIEFNNEITAKEHESVLEIITIIGCLLSLLGLLGIFLTAIIFPKWRIKVGRKILLQLSLTIFLELTIIYLADSHYFLDKTLGCTIIGICLHYVELAKFSWMFVSAILQYIRFVKVLAVLPSRLVLKTMLFGWCLPLIPVALVAYLFQNDYSIGAQKFCYPTGMGLYVGLFGPVVLIVTANLIVFMLIMRNIFKQHVDGHSKAKKSQKLQIYLGILLFFMLGVPWIFGILAEMLTGSLLQLIFIYLFCLTATLQGCVLFVFYVIMDPETKKLWLQVFVK